MVASEINMADDKVQESIAIEHMESHREDTKPTGNAIEEFIQSEKGISTWQAIKTHKRILGYALFSFACAMNYGYDTISNGSSIAMPAFIISFGAVNEATGSLYLPSLWTSLWTSMSNLGQALGAFMAGVLGQTVGRRYTALIFAVMSVVGTFLLFFATSRGMLLVGKTINGAVVGGLMSIGTTYAADIAPIKLRGALLQAIVFFAVAIQGVSLGVVRAFVPDQRPVAWKIVFSIQWIFAVLVFVLSLVVPESPVFCAAKGKAEQARHALRRLHGNDPDLELRYQAIVHALEEERRQQDASASWTELFKGSNLKRTLTIAFIMFSTSAIGIPFLTQNIYFLFTVGLAATSVFDIGIGGFFLGALFVVLGWVSNDKIGRRRLWIYGLIGNFVCMVTVGGLAYSGTQGSYWAIGVIMNLLISYGVYATVGIAWTICPEISSHRLRQYSQSVGFFTGAVGGWLFSFVTPYMYNVDSGNLGAKTGFIYAGLTVVVFAISWFIIPETAGLSVEDIDNAYEKGTSPREFAKLRVE
ncbi:Alpha-glucosides permease MPH2 [Talaromyces pinophilus]|nr:Alpha-glucosides permease MPH2 [Talaromyces pinophilus]